MQMVTATSKQIAKAQKRLPTTHELSFRQMYAEKAAAAADGAISEGLDYGMAAPRAANVAKRTTGCHTFDIDRVTV
jgi:hypothetical protein